MTVVDARRQPLQALADAAARAADGAGQRAALEDLADAAVEATGADLVVLRLRSVDGGFPACAVSPPTSTLAGEVAGTRAELAEVEAGQVSAATRRAADAVRASGVHLEPAVAHGRVVGCVEVVRVASPLDELDEDAARLVATQLALLSRLEDTGETAGPRGTWLELAGDALAAGGDTRRAAQQALRVAVKATGAAAGAVWRIDSESGDPELLAACGELSGARRPAAALAREATRAAAGAGRRGSAVAGRAAPRDHASARSAGVRGAPALRLRRRRAERERPRVARRLRRAHRACAAGMRAFRRAGTRARADAVAARGGGRGDLPAVARAHAGDGRRAGRGAVADRADRRVPAGGRAALCRRRPRPGGGAPRGRAPLVPAHARTAPRAADPAGPGRRQRSGAGAGARGARGGRPRLRRRGPAQGVGGADRPPRRLSRQPAADRGRAHAARSPRRAARRRRAERAAARAVEGAGRDADRGARLRAAVDAAAYRAVRDLALV